MEDTNNEAIDLLINLNQISLGELSPPSTYDFIRFSHGPLINTHAEFHAFADVDPTNEAFALNFSEPPEEFRQYLEELIQDYGEVGTDLNEWYSSSAESLVDTALEAGKVGKKTQGAIGYVLMSGIKEELSEEEFSEKSDIPDYFLESSNLNSSYYVFEGVLNNKRDIKIASITEDETAVAWMVGRALEEFDMDEEFKRAYNQKVEEYVEDNIRKESRRN
jgi:hypothetical protein